MPRLLDMMRRAIEAVIEQEEPLRADALAQRVARAHVWLRTGGRIRERIDLRLRDADRTAESGGGFVWKKGSVTHLMDYRPPVDAGSRRAIADIPLAERAGMVVANVDLLDQPDPALDEAIGRARANPGTVRQAG